MVKLKKILICLGEEPYDKFKKTLLRLPFNILYNILCLFSQKIIHLLSYSYQELLEAVEYIEEFCDSEEFRDKIRNLGKSNYKIIYNLS